MEYKEKYEQALKVAKETYNKQPMYREWLEKMFPELKESEDEKVRKTLIRFFKDSYHNETEMYGVTVGKALAWLEKQGEKKNRKASYTAIAETGNGGINALITRDIEIPFGAKDSELQKATYYIPKGYHAKIEGNKVTIKKGEQNPEENKGNLGGISPNWSEEEERCIRQLESMVKDRWALAEKAQDEEVIKNMSNLAFFLKTLNPNKKPADEDMKTLLRTEYEKGRADAIADMHWLKSLRPQNRWKPSDEQMEILLQAVAYFGVSWTNIDYLALQSLYFDLKKLKEEKV